MFLLRTGAMNNQLAKLHIVFSNLENNEEEKLNG